MNIIPNYRPAHESVNITGREAYEDYMKTSKIRDPKKFDYYTDYRRITRKIWKKIAESSVEYENGFYDPNFFYLIPQVVANKPYVELPGGRIKSNAPTNGDMYTPVFTNLLSGIENRVWSVDGAYTESYKDRLKDTIKKYIPKYVFILDILRKNKI